MFNIMNHPNFKLALYLTITLLTEFLSRTPEDLNTGGWSWVQWGRWAISITIPALVVWRAFVDQSVSRKIAETTDPIKP